MDTMELTVQRSVRVNVRINAIKPLVNVGRVRMEHGELNVKINVRKDAIIPVVQVKRATPRRVSAHVKWVFMTQRVISNVAEDVM